MIQPIFQDMLDDNNPKNVPFPQGRGDVNPAGIYYGPYLPHDGFRPENSLFPEEPRGTWMTPEALTLVQGVADRVNGLALSGPIIVDIPPAPGEGTWMSPRAVLRAMALQRRWLKELRKPIPDQKFPLEDAA